MDRPLHPDDIVAKGSNESQLGVVERTHGDVDTHDPYPERNEVDPIKHDREINQTTFRKFKRDGVPPKGTVLVRWEDQQNAQLIPESKLKLLDRSLLIGDVVKKNVQDAMSGVIVNTMTSCTLQPMGDIKYKDNYVLKGLLPPTPPEPGIRQTATGRPPPIVDVPASELTHASKPSAEELVLYKDWIGRVLAVTESITLMLADGYVVEIADELATHADGAVDTFATGDIAMTKKGHLRTGKWVFGQYSPNTPPIGTVVQTRPVAVEVSWLQKRIGSKSEVEPPSLLEREELESQQFHVYDRTRWPSTATTPNTVSNSEIDIALGSRVHFKDIAGACVKYDASTKHGKVPRILRQDTRGYDINVFDVVKFHTKVTVQWQDLTITEEDSIDLVPDTSIDDEHAAWPGEIAHTLDVSPVPDVPSVEQPSKVGVIQSVNAAERMARIKWAPDAVLTYSSEKDEESGMKPLLTGAVGIATGEMEEVSLYDLEAPAAMNVRRGDIVLITHQTWKWYGGTPGLEAIEEREWLGEIVDTCLDGTLTVRLGAARTVQDVNVRREAVVVAVRSDGTEAVDDWDEEEEEEYDEMLESAGDLPAWFPRTGLDEDMNDDEDRGEEDDDSDEEDDEPRATYEDENGQLLDADDVEDDDWESEDEDEKMPDLIPQQTQTPPTSTPITPPDAGKPNDVMPLDSASQPPSKEPEQYLVLSDAPPASHRYASEPSSTGPAHMKRVQKEHRILQKSGALPGGVYVRTWESRLDLIRALFIGPSDTPYQDAPFVIDFYLPPSFPSEPPQAFFHSWSGESGLGGVGRVNPNLYEDGKICLSLLGTWEGSKGEGWNAARSTLLQVVVSLLGLVLVKEPYFNEAGYEHLAGLEASKRPSVMYSERVYLRAKTFVIIALSRLHSSAGSTTSLGGLEDVVRWLYWTEGGPRLTDKVVSDMEEVVKRSKAGDAEPDGLTVMSKGACIPLRRALERLRQFQ